MPRHYNHHSDHGHSLYRDGLANYYGHLQSPEDLNREVGSFDTKKT